MHTNLPAVAFAVVLLCRITFALRYVVASHGAAASEVNHSPRYRRSSESGNITIHQMDITSAVASRFAVTTVRSELENAHAFDAETTFVVQIPETAFISNFSMVIDAVEYVAEVKSKDDALREYEQARADNRSAGHVSHSARTPQQAERGLELFSLRVNVKANSSVSLRLEYQQLLQRKLGVYENRLSVRPQQIVDRLTATVDVYEPQGIVNLTVTEPGAGASRDAVVTPVSAAVQNVVYRPSPQRQRQIDASGDLGDLTLRYDVRRDGADDDVGLWQRHGNYFVHFYAPPEQSLHVLGKNIVFVIDVSGSMGGRKIEQTREAMLAVLDQLHAGDRLLLMLFSSSLSYWPTSSQQLRTVTDDVIDDAQAYVTERLVAGGGTNINLALVNACEILGQAESTVRGQNMIVFLTDGEPTLGVEDPRQITQNVVRACSDGGASIFTLGFGNNVNFDLLQSLAFRTGGFPTRIYEEDDAAAQLQEFYAQISRPLLYDVIVSYPNDAIETDTLTSSTFAQYFAGSELVVAGKLRGATESLMDVYVEAAAADAAGATERYRLASAVDTSPATLPPSAANIGVGDGYIEKLYVYMKIKDLLRELLTLDDPALIDARRQYALQLALDYQLVTPLTSMVLAEDANQRTLSGEEGADFGRGGGGGGSHTYSSGSSAGETRMRGDQVMTLTLGAIMAMVVSCDWLMALCALIG